MRLFAPIIVLFLLTSCGSAKKSTAPDIAGKATYSPSSKKEVTASNSDAHHARKPATPLRKRELKQKYASVLKTTPRKIKNRRLYYFIDDWYGVKYKWGGNTQSGVDCSGLVCQLYKEVYGLKVKRTVATQHQETRNFKRMRRLREGDFVYFRTEGNKPSHVGIYLRNGYFVHASQTRGVAINSLEEDYWQRVYAGGGKVKKKK